MRWSSAYFLQTAANGSYRGINMRRCMLIAQEETQPRGLFFDRRVNNRLDVDARLEQRIGEFCRL